MKKDETKSSDLSSSNDVDQLLSSLGLENLVKSARNEQYDTPFNSKSSSTSKNDHKEEILFEVAIKKFVLWVFFVHISSVLIYLFCL